MAHEVQQKAMADRRISYRIGELQDVTGIPRSAWYQALTAGTLRTFKVGRGRYVSAEALREFLARAEGQA